MRQVVTSGVVLVTGGAGFIGSHLVEHLLARGMTVVSIDNLDSFYAPAIKRANLLQAQKSPNFTFVQGNILDKDLLDNVFKTQSVTRVIHLAALAGVRPSLQDPSSYIEVDVKGTVHLLELCATYRVCQFIFASSSSVYGGNPALPYHEDASTDIQVSPYGAAKKSAELYCGTYHHLYGIPTTILRFFTVYGPRQRPEMAIHKFTRLLNQGLPVSIFGDGTSTRDYTYIDDIVAGISSAVDCPLPFEIINLGNSSSIPLLELVKEIAHVLGVPPSIEYLPPAMGDVHATQADLAKANRLLGYRPHTELRNGLIKFVEWYHQNQRLLTGALLS